MSPTPRHLRANARAMRRAPTDAESALWRLLRDRRFSDYKFRRQTPLGPFIVDFLCFEARLIVEADGGQHADNSDDRDRDAWLAAQGFRIRRFWNAEILTQPTMVADTLAPRSSSGVARTVDPSTTMRGVSSTVEPGSPTRSTRRR